MNDIKNSKVYKTKYEEDIKIRYRKICKEENNSKKEIFFKTYELHENRYHNLLQEIKRLKKIEINFNNLINRNIDNFENFYENSLSILVTFAQDRIRCCNQSFVNFVEREDIVEVLKLNFFSFIPKPEHIKIKQELIKSRGEFDCSITIEKKNIKKNVHIIFHQSLLNDEIVYQAEIQKINDTETIDDKKFKKENFDEKLINIDKLDFSALDGREIKILNLIRKGLNSIEISIQLNASVSSINCYRSAIKKKIGLSDYNCSLKTLFRLYDYPNYLSEEDGGKKG